MDNSTKKNRTKKRILFGIITMLFFFWGLANNMTDTMLAAFKHILEMTDTQTSFIQFAFYGAYFCFALPAAFFIKKNSYKAGIILGLLLYATGAMLFFPAAGLASYAFYLVAIYIMAGGCSVLETVANPYILSMEEDPKEGMRKLNLAQSFNPVGSIIGIMLSRFLILDNLQNHNDTLANSEVVREELDSVTVVYATVGEVLLIFMVVLLFMNVPSYGNRSSINIPFIKSVSKLFSRSRFTFGVIAEFFYVGAQIGVWSFVIRTVMTLTGKNESASADIYLLSIVLFTCARFLFTFLMKFYKPVKLLITAGIGALLCTFAVVFASGYIAVAGLVGISFFMSLMFPTIYGSALEKTGQERQIGGSILIMSILGGAIITPVQAMVSDQFGPQNSFLVPAVCFMIVIAYALHIYLKEKDSGLSVRISEDE